MKSQTNAVHRCVLFCLCVFISGFCFRSAGSSVSGSKSAQREVHLGLAKLQQLEELEISECVELRSMIVCQERDGGRSMARFPNLIGHTNEVQASESLKKYLPLFDFGRKHEGDSSVSSAISCGLNLRKFICPLYAPACTPGVDITELPPCRQVCRKALEDCLGAMQRIRVSWPREWNCESFPMNGLCLNVTSSIVTPEPDVRDHVRQWQPSSGSLMPPPSSTADHVLQLRNNLPDDRSKESRVAMNISANGVGKFFHGWVDVQGRGMATDYCRVIGTNVYNRFLLCSLGGINSTHVHPYISKRGFDVGHWKTWYMKDVDGDGRDDYCRCVGRGQNASEVCMKAGSRGFYGSRLQPGSEYSFSVLKPASSSPCMTSQQAASIRQHLERLHH